MIDTSVSIRRNDFMFTWILMFHSKSCWWIGENRTNLTLPGWCLGLSALMVSLFYSFHRGRGKRVAFAQFTLVLGDDE